MELAHATCPALTPDLMFLSNSAQLPLKRLHVQRTVKISKKSNVTSGKTTPIEKAFLDLLNEQRLCIQKNFIRHNRLCQDHLHLFFSKKEEAQECFLSKTRIFYEMNVSVVIFIIYLYWHLFNKVLYVFHICCFRRIFFCVCVINKSLI